MDKHSSLLQKFVNYGRKKFCNIGPRCRIKLILKSRAEKASAIKTEVEIKTWRHDIQYNDTQRKSE